MEMVPAIDKETKYRCCIVLCACVPEGSCLCCSMTVYGVLSTGDSVGVIEVVRNAETLAQIHKTRGGAKAALDDKALLEWLKSHNRTDDLYDLCGVSLVHVHVYYC